MRETRAGKYGRNLAVWVNFTIEKLPEAEREDYRARFLAELDEYSFMPRKKGEPRNAGCVRELEGIICVHIPDPEHLAKLVKEGFHFHYNKQTSARIWEAVKKGVIESLV